MPEEQKSWVISVKMNSKDCKFREHIPNIDNGKYNNYGEIRCTHPRYEGMICCITRKEYCPLKYDARKEYSPLEYKVEYPLDPKFQVDKDDV